MSYHPFKNKRTKQSFFNDDLDTIKNELSRAFESGRPSTRTRAPKLRSSSLPYCPLQEAYQYLRDGEQPPQMEEFPMMSFVTIGTIVHELLQNWVPRFVKKIKVIGLWDATTVGCEETQCPFKSNRPIQALNYKGCSKCGKIPHYEEIASNSKFTSHTDWLFQIKGTKRVYILDIKTTSLGQVRLHDMGKGKFPQKAYISQTDSYAVQLYPLLTAMGFQLCGTMIVYIPRDAPPNYRVVPIRTSITPEFIEETKTKLYRVSDGYVKVSKLLKQNGHVKMEALEDIMAHKLCDSREEYDECYTPDYGDPCPLRKVCFGNRLYDKVDDARKQFNKRLKSKTD